MYQTGTELKQKNIKIIIQLEWQKCRMSMIFFLKLCSQVTQVLERLIYFKDSLLISLSCKVGQLQELNLLRRLLIVKIKSQKHKFGIQQDNKDLELQQTLITGELLVHLLCMIQQNVAHLKVQKNGQNSQEIILILKYQSFQQVLQSSGNKTDLQDNRQVTTDQAKQLAQQKGLFFLQTSAKQAEYVDTAFMEIIKQITTIMNRPQNIKPSDPISPGGKVSGGKALQTTPNKDNKKKGCC